MLIAQTCELSIDPESAGIHFADFVNIAIEEFRLGHS